ncbi:MAG: SDR family NAD(P)-dependent oxidoreductase [Alphaproteobacteria bacterium]|jgi:NAD(P)-dependent dehydrogenase (short-subunit alcohol dehydrogenase family)|nr:SDR family NAD(P)-dependent oxidoreductase [Alphaproteobacteria bacterium]
MANGAIYPSLRDRVVFVSGGASGIGAAIVEQFCEQGAKVSFVDIDEDAGEALAGGIAARDLPRPRFLACDLKDVEALQHAIGQVITADGPITALINNAANDERHSIDDVTPEYFDDRIAVNLRHQFFATQAVHGPMAEAGGGAIVNIGSVTWLIGQGGMPCYSASKAAIAGLTRSLARDLGPKNIRVNSVLPGWIMTKRQIDNWLTSEGEQELLTRQCLKRPLQPEDLARVVLFFAADDSGICTNQNYIADGGWV